MAIQIGDALPAGTLHEGTPRDHVDPASAFSSGRVLVFAVPGAFTPGCDKTHLPGYLADFDKIRAKGIDQVACISVNDAFVMAAWGEAHQTDGKIRMLADPAAAFTQSLGLEVDATGALGGVRSKRYAMLVEDGRVTHLQVEPDGFGLSCSLAASFLETL